MTYFLIFCVVVAWLNIGILAFRSTNDLVDTPLETLSLPIRLIMILLAPIGLLIYERHLFYDKAKPGTLSSDDKSLP
jgi:hypothetical protein